MFSNQGVSDAYIENLQNQKIGKKISSLVVIFFVPWMVFLILFLLGIADGYVHGADMRNGGATVFFQAIGLYPHKTFIMASWIFGVGMMLVSLSIFSDIMMALSGMLQKTRYGPIYQAVIQPVKDHRYIAAVLASAIIVGISFVVMPVHSVKPPVVTPSVITKQTYSRVLLALPNMRHAISGNAQVKQVGAHTYLVKMVSDHR